MRPPEQTVYSRARLISTEHLIIVTYASAFGSRILLSALHLGAAVWILLPPSEKAISYSLVECLTTSLVL